MIKRGKNKRGQVTLFIIIAVVVVALGVTTWMLWPRIQEAFMTEAEAQTFLASEGINLKSAVHDCVSEIGEDIIRDQGMNAGYYTYRHLYALDFAGPKVVVMYKDDNRYRLNELPSLDTIKGEFGQAFELEGYRRIDTCLNNFEEFKKKMGVVPGSRTISLEIYDEEVAIRVDWPIEISKADATATVEQKDVNLLIPLGRVWTIANDIVSYEVQQENFIWKYEEYIRNHDNLMRYTKLEMQNHPTADQTTYMLRTEKHRIGEEEFLFNFAVDRA